MLTVLEKKINLYCAELNISIQEFSILLSFSGGVDSTLLASLLVELRDKYAFELNLIHFNHNVHQKSVLMEKFCQSFAKENNVDYYIRKFSFKNLVNFEASAREKRYSELDNLSNELNIPIVFTAHHLDDQIETLYMKMLDKSDWISQIGIRHSLGKIRRPLLDVRKETIRKTAHNNRLKWIEDPTNDDMSIRRNYVRNIVLPSVLKAFPEKINELLNNAHAYKLRMNNKISTFNNQKEEFIKYNSDEYISIFIDKINDFEIEYLKIFIYWCSSKYFKINIPPMSRQFWITFSNYLNQSKTGSKFTIGQLTSIINRNELFLIPTFSNLFSEPEKMRLIHNKTWYSSYFHIIQNHNTIYSANKNQFSISSDLFKSGLYMRRWKEGDKIKSSASKKHILISDLFINNKLSMIGKLIHPIIVDKADQILWVPSMAHAELPIKLIKQKMKVIEWIQV